MGLYSIKPWFVRRLRRLEDLLVAHRVSPDALTAAAVLISLAAGGAIAAGGLLDVPALWLAVPPLVLGRLALNALDGSVARRTGRARQFGAVLNELGDRMSDAAVVGAAGFVAPPALAAGAVSTSFLASLTGVLALAVTGKRDSGGPAGKADRAAMIALGAIIGALLGSALPFVVVLWTILGGGVLTAATRLARIKRDLASRRPRLELLAETLIPVPTEAPVDEENLHALCR